jgi:hypothetical protein
MSGSFVTGWIKDKFDNRDYLHRAALVRFPNAVDLSRLLPEVRYQGAVSSCTGFGIGANVGAVAKSLHVFTEWYSPTWIYNGARFIEGTLTSDIGAYPKDCFDWLLKMGCLLEHFWPYDPDKADISAPSSERQAQALKYPEFAYFRCVDGVNGIMSALADSEASVLSGGPGWLVSIGSPWFDKWMNVEPSGILSNVSAADHVAGGHETILAGYDQEKGLFFGQNSWGIGWGASGRFYLPFQAIDVFKQLGGYDAHYLKFKPLPSPPVIYHLLNISVNGNGTTDPTVGTYPYVENTVVDINAIPASGWQFVNWTGGVLFNSASSTIVMDADKSITANFQKVPQPPQPSCCDWFKSKMRVIWQSRAW